MKNHVNIIIIGVTILVSVMMMTSTYKNRNRSNDIINVTGLGKRDFKSDLIVWNGSFETRAYELKSAYASLKEDQKYIMEYLVKKGVKKKEILFSSVDIDTEFDYTYDKDGNSA